MGRLIVVTGIPGSGKTEFAKKEFGDKPDHLIISLDDIRYSVHMPYIEILEKFIWILAFGAAGLHIRTGMTVVIDESMSGLTEFKDVYSMLCGSDIPIQAYCIKADERKCKELRCGEGKPFNEESWERKMTEYRENEEYILRCLEKDNPIIYIER